MKFIKIKLIIAFFIAFNYSSAQLNLSSSSTLNTNCNGTDCSCDGPSILINEVVMSPSSGDGSLYDGPGQSNAAAGEWIELYNPNLCLPVDISCYYLGNAAKDGGFDDYAGGFVFPPGTIVPPRGFLVVRGVNAPEVPDSLLGTGTDPGKTIEIIVDNPNQVCLETGAKRLWFPNAGGWFAFYDRNGEPQDAIYWGDSASFNSFNKATNPCVPAFPGCNFSGTLASFSGIPQARKTYISDITNPDKGKSYRREPDGGPWVLNIQDPTPSMGACNTTCNDPIISTCNGTATVNVTGGNGNYSYKWDDSFGQTTNPATKLCDGTYHVTVTDNANNETATTTVVVTNNTVTVTMNPSTQAICSGQSATITASGANASTYTWSPITSSNSSITVSPTNPTNNYAVSITDIDGCTGSNTATITVTIPVVTVADTIICLGDAATLHAHGANTYVWNNGQTGSPLIVTPTTIGNHIYTVTGTSNGCTGTADAVVSVEDCQVQVEIDGGTICQGECFDLTALINIGTANSYTWSHGLPPTAGPHQVCPTVPTTYTVTVTNADGFSDTDTAVVTVSPNPVITFNPPNPTICAGTSVQISASGANTYVWSPSTGLNSTTGSTVTASPADTLTYTVTGTLNGCTGIGTVTVNVAPNPIIVATPVSTTCGYANGSVTVSTSSGTAPFHYSWNTNPNYDTTSVSNLSSDIYNIHVSDANGCTSSVTTTVASSTPITITGTIVDEVCSGDLNGSIDVSVINAVAPLTYTWSNGATTQDLNAIEGGKSYTLTVTDANNCAATKVFTVGTHPFIYASVTSLPEYCAKGNGAAIVKPQGGTPPYIYSWNSNPAQNTAVASNLPAGNYSVTVTDGFCSASASVPVNFVNGPTATVDSIIHASCELNNAEAYVQISEGTAPFNYTWSNGIIQTTPNITNVYAGTYILTVTDSKGCTDTAKAIINGSNIPTALITHTITAHCGYSNGAITVGVANGNGPYQYEWNTNPVQTDTVAKGVPAGTYIVTITDNTGCTTTVSGVVPQFPGPTVKLTSSPDICLQANGTATAKCNGGHGAPYTYLWNTGDTTGMITGLATGSYSVTISDGGCQASSTIEVPLINGPNADFMIHPIATTILESNIFFTDQTMGPIVNWTWTLGDGAVQNISEFSYNYQGPGVYPVSMVVVDTNNCVDTIRDTIIIRDIFTIYIPNSFTPNDDGFNDGFSPKGTNIDTEGFEMYIFNRWGNQMYFTDKWGGLQASEPWDGTINNTGSKDDIIFDVYVYKIVVKEINGPKHQYFGKITLIQ